MKIVFVISQMTSGGAERQASILCNHWAGEGHRVVLVTLHGAPPHYTLDEAVIQRVAGTKLSSLRSILTEEVPDIIISFLNTTNVKVLWAARGTGRPVIVSERSIPAALWWDNSLARAVVFALLRRTFYRQAAALVVQTDAVAKWARKRVRRVAIIPNAVLPLVEGGVGVTGRRKTLLAVGRLSREKGHDVLIRAFARIADCFPEWHLKIVGEGAFREWLEVLVQSLGVDDRVTLAPVTRDITRDYCEAGVFVLPSRFEGFPNALIEAMQCGCAVVAADCPVAPREILHNGRDGLLFASESDVQLAEKLTGLMGDPPLRASLGAAAMESVKKYSSQAVLPLWDSLIAQVIDE